MSTDLSVISASQGTFIVNNTDSVTVLHDAIVVLEDTVFDIIDIDGEDAMGEYIQDSSVAVKAGAIIRPKDAKKFSKVALTSGSVCLVL